MSKTLLTKMVAVEYVPGEQVMLDKEITGYVTEVCIFTQRILYEVRWMHNGDSRKDYFDGFRLKAVP
jgi:hypothetical protein